MICMADSEWSERKEKAPREHNWKLLAKNKDFSWGKNIKKISSEILLQSLTNLFKNYFYQLDIKQGQFTGVAFDRVLKKKKLKAENLLTSTKYLLRYGRLWTLMTYYFRLCNGVHKQNTIEKWKKSYILPFPNNSDIGITKNYKGMNLTVIIAKLYDILLFSCIQLEKILGRIRTVFREINPASSNHWRSTCKKSRDNHIVGSKKNGVNVL